MKPRLPRGRSPQSSTCSGVANQSTSGDVWVELSLRARVFADPPPGIDFCNPDKRGLYLPRRILRLALDGVVCGPGRRLRGDRIVGALIVGAILFFVFVGFPGGSGGGSDVDVSIDAPAPSVPAPAPGGG